MYDLNEELLILLQRGDMCSPNITKLAKALRTSNATVHRKIRGMEEKGIIQEYVAHIAPEKVGRPLTSFVRIQLNYPGTEALHEEFIRPYVEKLNAFEEVQEIYVPLGTWDLFIKVKAKDIADQYQLISKIMMKLGDIRRMESLVMMKSIKESMYVHPEG